jgi:integrase
MARGSIIPRGDTYSVVVPYKDSTGKRRQVWRTARTKREAEKLRTELLSQVDTDTLARPGKLTVQQHLDQWLAGYSVALSPQTQDLYAHIIRKHIGPAIGGIALGQLRPQHLQTLYAEKIASGLSPRTVQMMHNLAHKALSNAVRTGLLARNPVDLVDSPKVSRHEIRVMSETDLGRFLDETRQTTPYFALFYTYLFTGLRRGEALALRWSDIDFMLCQLGVNRSLSYRNGAEPGHRLTFKKPKTATSRRSVSLSPSTMAVLKVHREEQDELRNKLGLPPTSDDDLVFCHWDGRPFLPSSITHAWIRVARRCGLDGVRLHDSRHTHATLLLKAGVHPRVLMERLGHASFTTTMNIYAHVAPGLQQAAANRFDDVVIGESVSKPLASADRST